MKSIRPSYTLFVITAVVMFAYLFVATEKVAGQVVVAPAPVVVAPVVAPPVVVAPPIYYVPRVTYQPYQYQRSEVVERRYKTPLRNLFFGRWRAYHYYAPAKPEQHAKKEEEK